MDLRKIRYFHVVANELSFTRAAQRLHMAQPPLSRQIHQLEEDLGAQLFERQGRAIRLTDAGRFFLEQTRQLVARLEDVADATRRIAEKRRRWFGIGFVPSLLYSFGPTFIHHVSTLDENVEIGLLEMTTMQQFDALRSGQIDIGFGRVLLEDPDIERLVLVQEKLALVVPAGHHLAQGGQAGINDIGKEPFILYPAKPRPSYADEVIALFQRYGIELDVRFEANELQTAIGLVAAGLGVSIVPASVRCMRRDDIAFVDVDAAAFTSPVMMSWRRGSASPFLQRVISLAKAAAAGSV